MTGLPLRAYARLWAWALLLRPLKHVVAFGTLVRWAHARPRRRRLSAFEGALAEFITRGAPFPRRAPGNCLERSLGVYRLLCEEGAGPEIVVGIRKDATAGIQGHVWVAVDGRPFAEPAGALDGYVSVVRYDAGGRAQAIGEVTTDLARVRLV